MYLVLPSFPAVADATESGERALRRIGRSGDGAGRGAHGGGALALGGGPTLGLDDRRRGNGIHFGRPQSFD